MECGGPPCAGGGVAADADAGAGAGAGASAPAAAPAACAGPWRKFRWCSSAFTCCAVDSAAADAACSRSCCRHTSLPVLARGSTPGRAPPPPRPTPPDALPARATDGAAPCERSARVLCLCAMDA